MEGTVFENDVFGVRVAGSASPDLGGGLLGSVGFNTLIASSLSVSNETGGDLSARFNWWGCPTTAEMDASLANVTSIWDEADNPAYGSVDYVGYLGSVNRRIDGIKETGGGASDVVLSWAVEPTGALTVLRGIGPDMLMPLGTSSGGSYRDVGALGGGETFFYRVDGPCP